LVAIAVAIAFRDVGTSALVDRAWSVADAALVEFADAVVYVVTNAIGIGVGSAVATAYAEGVELVSITVAVASSNVSAVGAIVKGCVRIKIARQLIHASLTGFVFA
jgi:hypothetical protein